MPTAVFVEPRGELAGGSGETGPISQALRPAKTDGQGTTENNGAQDTIKSLELARQTLSDAGQAGPAELIQQQIDALKGKAKESDKGTTNSPLSRIKSLRWRRVKLVKQIAKTKDEEQNLRKKAAEALVEAENAKSRFEQLQVELAKVDAEVADACVAVQSEGVQATSAQQFLRIETHLHKLSEQQKGATGVSELPAAANAATQALADKLASVVPAMDLAGGTEGSDVKPVEFATHLRSEPQPISMRPKRLNLYSTMTFDPRPCEISASWENACARPNVSVAGASRDGGCITIEGSLAASVPCGTTRIDRVFARPPPPPQAAKWALKVETVNSSNSGPAKSWLSMTDASVVLLQEHHLPPDRCDEAKVWCRK